MTDKFKKIDKEYVLSDSSVNEYGFRLLTSGYQLGDFQKNPIGYYMHRREDGVVIKWDDLQISDGKVTGRPVINLCNERGLQTCDEAENGFLNAASVGHIVVLEYSTDPELMLPGQTGPTITKWYNKECSLVDIPGNGNSLTKLYDAQENEMNLVDLNIKSPLAQAISISNHTDIYMALGLVDNAGEDQLLNTIKDLAARALKADELAQENILLHSDKHNLQTQLDDLKAAQVRHQITALLDKALEDKKITRELQLKLAEDYAVNPEGLQALIKAMPVYRSIVSELKNTAQEKTELQWSWDEFEANDKSGKKLLALKAGYPDRYREIFSEKFGL